MNEEKMDYVEEQLDYLKYMHKNSCERIFTDEEIKKIHVALKTNVDATNSIEALDMTADIITEQLYRGVDIEKFEAIANDILRDGKILGADNAVKVADSLNFRIEVRRENITSENANRIDPLHGNSFLESSLYSAKSPKIINEILDKGGLFGPHECVECIVDKLLERVTDHYKWQKEDYGEGNIKNNLENLSLLVDRGIIEKPKDLGRLASNPELFEKYPDIMNKLLKGYNMQDYKNAKGLQDYYDRHMSWISDSLEKAKVRVRHNLEKNKAIATDIKDGMEKTKESGYGYISRTPKEEVKTPAWMRKHQRGGQGE